MPEYAVKIVFEFVAETADKQEADKIGYAMINHLKLEELNRGHAYVDDINLLGDDGFYKQPPRQRDDF